MQSNASPLARSVSLSSDTRDNQDPPISDSRSASGVDVDSRWEVCTTIPYLLASFTNLHPRNHAALSTPLEDL